MKKLILLVAIVLVGFNANAQGELNAGIFGGIPVGDAGDFTTFSLGVDLDYLFEVSESFSVGPAVGFSTSFLDSEFEGDNISFLPITAAGRYAVSEEFTLGADVGYALGINDGNEGGFYYAPKIQYGISDSLDVAVSYRSVNEDNGSFDLVTISFIFLLFNFGSL